MSCRLNREKKEGRREISGALEASSRAEPRQAIGKLSQRMKLLVGFLFPCFKCIKPGLKPCSCSDQWQSSHFTLLPSRLVPGTRSIQKPPRALMAMSGPPAWFSEGLQSQSPLAMCCVTCFQQGAGTQPSQAPEGRAAEPSCFLSSRRRVWGSPSPCREQWCLRQVDALQVPKLTPAALVLPCGTAIRQPPDARGLASGPGCCLLDAFVPVKALLLLRGRQNPYGCHPGVCAAL